MGSYHQISLSLPSTETIGSPDFLTFSTQLSGIQVATLFAGLFDPVEKKRALAPSRVLLLKALFIFTFENIVSPTDRSSETSAVDIGRSPLSNESYLI